jgi:hypothetical protein
MGSDGVVDREAITAAFDALDAAVDGMAALKFDALTTREWLALLERVERVRRRQQFDRSKHMFGPNVAHRHGVIV